MKYYEVPDAPESVKHWSGSDPSDSGYCPNCEEHIDSGRCECIRECIRERERLALLVKEVVE